MSPARGRMRLLLAGVMMAAGATMGGCFRGSLVPFTLAVPPQVLVPASHAAIVDGRARFREIWCAIRDDHGWSLPEDRPCADALLRLEGEGPPSGQAVALGPGPGSLRVVVVGGLLAECVARLARPLSDGLAHLDGHGYRTTTVMVSGRSGSQHNAAQIRDAVLTMALETGERLLLVGHSKGAVDILEALVRHPEIVPRVAAVVSVAGAINGSPLAEGLHDVHAALLQHAPVPGCDAGDGGALASLRRTERLRFLASASLPREVRYFSLTGIVEHRETARLLRPTWRRLARLDSRNDGQLLWTDTVIPGATLLGYVRADHWAIAVPFSRQSPALAATLVDHNAFPREVLLEAIVRTVEESL